MDYKNSKKQAHRIAWVCLMKCLKKGYPLDIWFCPLDEKEKKEMLEQALKEVKNGNSVWRINT